MQLTGILTWTHMHACLPPYDPPRAITGLSVLNTDSYIQQRSSIIIITPPPLKEAAIITPPLPSPTNHSTLTYLHISDEESKVGQGLGRGEVTQVLLVLVGGIAKGKALSIVTMLNENDEGIEFGRQIKNETLCGGEMW